MSEPTHYASDRYPEFAHDYEARRRWRLVSFAALAMYAYQAGEPFSGSDRMVVEQTRRALFASDLPSGDGDLADFQLDALVDLGLL